ncbi:MAG: BrnT family toxin [Anaerolineaceae bacterium]|nr:BrnT family toxin [Anaerolineaceae bacterium]
MSRRRVIWLPDIEDKLLQKHGVLAEEVEEVLFDTPRIYFVEKGSRADEDLYAATGQTEAGRYLIVFFILKPKNEALIISARDMDRKERKRYGRRKG